MRRPIAALLVVAGCVLFIVNFWRGTDPVVYETFVDYESPETRELQN